LDDFNVSAAKGIRWYQVDVSNDLGPPIRGSSTWKIFEGVVSCVSFSSLASTVLHLGLGGIVHCFGCLRLCVFACFLGYVF
jgi:hypothetical protein